MSIKILANPMHSELIALCGMNCRLCRAYIREKKICPGCYGTDTSKSKSCAMCKIKNCEMRISNNFKYCFQCEQFPCHKINHIDTRYRIKYGMSMIENLIFIKQFGIAKFIDREKEKWTCPKCGEIICVHRENCIYCAHKWR